MSESPTLECRNIVERRKKESLPVYDCGLGCNILEPPPVFYELIKKYANRYQYSSIFGEPELVTSLKKEYSSNVYDIEHVMIGHGLKEILFCFHMAFGGTVFHITPKWVSYDEHVKLCNNTFINVTVESDTMKINPEKLERMLTSGNISRALLFNNPNNPTGVSYTKEEVEEIAMVCKRTNTIIFTDEIYMNLQYDEPFVSIAEYAPELTIRASSISKDFAAGGYRLGWALFPSELKFVWREMTSIGSSIYSCVNPVVQLATAELLSMDHYIYFEYQKCYFKKLMKAAMVILKETPLLFVKPTSTWYIFVNFSNVIKKMKIQMALQMFLVDKLGIVCLGGEHFGYHNGFIRFSIKNKNSLEGLRVLKKYINSL
jgi:aspartate aminotransferase